ncbi:hypothetical protein OUZ56_012113 [Daphnia magna]|uniref:Uncharacterized protein n=1 Tax=Daphnia magna TaxID=35525 RepID=A0ABQ9Z238_9CRUS|nr:hypothetical protein OUZ56_012113 [Daphnia magna]
MCSRQRKSCAFLARHAQAVPEENSGNGHRSSTNASETDKPTSSDGPYSRKRSPGLYSTLFKKLRLPSAGRSRVLDEFDQYLIEKNSSMEHQENPEEKNWTEKQKRLYDVYHQEGDNNGAGRQSQENSSSSQALDSSINHHHPVGKTKTQSPINSIKPHKNEHQKSQKTTVDRLLPNHHENCGNPIVLRPVTKTTYSIYELSDFFKPSSSSEEDIWWPDLSSDDGQGVILSGVNSSILPKIATISSAGCQQPHLAVVLQRKPTINLFVKSHHLFTKGSLVGRWVLVINGEFGLKNDSLQTSKSVSEKFNKIRESIQPILQKQEVELQF